MTNVLLDAALGYAEKGWYLFPAREKDGKPYKNSRGIMTTPRTKMPYVKPGIHGATNDPKVIRSMWNNFPTACIGVNCGMSNLFVIDVDTHKGGSGLSNFMQMGISYNDAFQSVTPGNGLHIIYKGVGRTTTNSAIQVDTRGTGGYIILPPSWIEGSDGSKKAYIEMGDWSGQPMEIPPDTFKRLGLEKSINRVPSDYNKNETDKQTLSRATIAVRKLTTEQADDYSTWVSVGMSLFNLGDAGFPLWEEWTNKYFKTRPDSKRIGELEMKWAGFSGTNITLGTLFYHAKKAK